MHIFFYKGRYCYAVKILMNNLASVLAVEGCWVGSLFFCCDAGIHWGWNTEIIYFSIFFLFPLSTVLLRSKSDLLDDLKWPLCFLTYCLFCHHNSTWLHLNNHVIYCTCRLESSEVICSHSEKTSFPYAACYTERVVGFARVGDFQ